MREGSGEPTGTPFAGRIIVHRDEDVYDFSHGRIRDVAYAEISSVRKRMLHDRVAQTMLRHYGDEVDSISGQLAEHFVVAGRIQEAVDYLMRAGDRSADQFAYQEALDYFGRALALLPEDELALRYTILVRRLDIFERTQDANNRPQEMDALERVIDQIDDGSGSTIRHQADLAVRRAQYAYQVGLTHEAIAFA